MKSVFHNRNALMRHYNYLLEKFGVSDEFYHELSMLHPQFPRSYKVKGARKDISECIDLTPLPPPFSGAYRPL